MRSGSTMQVTLGPFHLQRQIGRGGMGSVYLAEHATQRTPMAIKVDLHPPDEVYSAAFLHEVEAVAALDHRNIVLVLEHGMVDEPAQIASKGELRAGNRWLAMELAQGGSIAQHPPRNWEETLHMARGTLDGLAHCHARNVIHRDIKPANLLLAGCDEGVSTIPADLLDARIVLSDFGISERHESTSTHTEESVGTPHYMAPEQIEAQWRDQGPWTDLYALGVLLWRVTTGAYPFEGRNAFQIYRAHLLQEPGAYVPKMGVPPGLEEILRTSLAKPPNQRFAYAARMRSALDALGGAVGDLQSVTICDEDTVQAEAPTRGTAGPTRQRHRHTSTGARARNFQLQGAGLSLFGLRTPPLVGRDTLCDTLWGKLVEVRAVNEARVVVLRGTSGTGKTRLAMWLCERAHELGVVSSMRAQFTPGLRPAEALLRMLRHRLRTDDLHADALKKRLESLFPDPPFDRPSLAALLSPHLSQRGAFTRREARVLILAVLTHLAQREALILHLDDAHLDLESLELVDHLLALQRLRPSPLLVVLTVREDALVEHPQFAELLLEISDDPNVAAFPIEGLNTLAQSQLVRALVGLEGAVAKQLEQRTAGNPMFAVQLIGAWIEQGVLVPGPDGFRVQSGAEQLPADLSEVWESRIEDALQGRSDDDLLALESAAALGLQVEHRAWTQVFDLLEITPSDDLWQELQRRHLISSIDTIGAQWRFVHGMLREVLERRARQENRWVDVNLAAAIQLQQSGVRAPERLARHLLAAEVWDQAAEPLEQALIDEFDRDDLRDDTLLQQLERVLDELQLPTDDPWRGRLGLIEAGRARGTGDLDEAERIVLSLVRTLDKVSWPKVRGRALREASRVYYLLGNLERAQNYAMQAMQAFEAEGDLMRATDASSVVAMILSKQGHYDQARERYLGCVEVFEANDWQEFLRGPLEALTFLEQRAGNLDQAKRWLKRTRAYGEKLGLSGLLANCANVEGEIHRSAGELELAASCYRESAARYEAIEDPAFIWPALNLGILDVGAGRHQAAIERMHQLLAWLERTPQPMTVMYTHMVLMAAQAAMGNRDEAGQSLQNVHIYLSNSSVADRDIALMAELTGDHLRRLGAARLAKRSYTLSIHQHRALGDEAEAQRLEARL